MREYYIRWEIKGLLIDLVQISIRHIHLRLVESITKAYSAANSSSLLESLFSTTPDRLYDQKAAPNQKVPDMSKISEKYLSCALGLALFLMAATPPFGLSKEKKGQEGWEAPAAAINPAIILTTTESLDGLRIKEYRGIVRGVTVRQPTIGQGFKAELKGIVGGKISPFISMCETARQQALEVMVERAQAVGANAVVGIRYDSSAFGESDDMGTEVVCYGTAVIVEPKDGMTKTAINE